MEESTQKVGWEKGVFFYFEFPLKEVNEKGHLSTEVTNPKEDVPAIPLEQQLTPISENLTQRILVVEDNDDLRNYILDILGAYQTLHAENGRVALEVLNTCKEKGQLPDLILSDIMMPEMDGLSLLAAVKSNEDFLSIPMMMLTAKSSAQSKLKALRIGVDDYLTKPFLEEELMLRVKNLLKNKEGRIEEESESEKPLTAPVIKKVDLVWLEKNRVYYQKRTNQQLFQADRCGQ